MSARDELITARDKLHAAAGFITHGLDGDCVLAEAIDSADRLVNVVAAHLQQAKVALTDEWRPEEDVEHGG